ncbi:MAG: hypothetical protein QGG87_05095, partial [Nitrospinota bacterium]|nr:hypothetical protein [Nitrospinota bacterium]
GSKAFIGGNPVKKIINSSRDIREILAVDLNACNNYRTGKESLEKINCSTLCIFGDLDKMVPLEVGNKMSSMIKNAEKNHCFVCICFFSCSSFDSGTGRV